MKQMKFLFTAKEIVFVNRTVRSKMIKSVSYVCLKVLLIKQFIKF